MLNIVIDSSLPDKWKYRGTFSGKRKSVDGFFHYSSLILYKVKHFFKRRIHRTRVVAVGCELKNGSGHAYRAGISFLANRCP